MKRTTRILLCLLCLVLTATVLVGCKKKVPEDTNKTPKSPTEDGVDASETLGENQYDLTAYAVVYTPSENGTNILAGMAQTLADRLTALTGLAVAPKTADNLSSASNALEILIGRIDAREESVEAYNSIEGVGFTVRASENKICVVGSDHLCTIWAMQYFLDNCVTKALTTPVVTVETVKFDNREMITVADITGGVLPIVYGADCWERADHADRYFRSLYSDYDLRAYPVKIAEQVTQRLMLATGAEEDRFTARSETVAATGGEFLIGVTGRAVGRSSLSDLDGDEYGFFAGKDNDGVGSVALASWSDIGLSTAAAMFGSLITEAAFRDSDNRLYFAFPDGFKCKGIYNENWVVDFPKPEGEGISLYNTADSGEDCLQFLYRGEGVCAAAFDAYVAHLTQNGYMVLSENTMAENKFATLVHKDMSVMLSVAYNAFAHKDEYDYNANPVFDDDTEDHYDYDFRFQKCLRVISCPTSNPKVIVPDDYILTQPVSATNSNAWTWKKVTENAITAIETISVGSGYVITLEDGGFIVIDGGGSTSENGGSTASLYRLLSKRYQEVYGREPDEEHRIPITAWIITHSHQDHWGAVCSFLDTYGKTTVRLEYLIGNWPASNVAYSLDSSDNGYMSKTGINRILAACPEAKLLKVHTGQTFYFANIKIDVLMTPEDHNPFRVDNSNDTNTVLRFSVYTRPGDTNPYKIIWLGDANRQQSRWMCAMYGDYLRADMVSIGHHGNVGCDIELYDTIQPAVAWFSHNSGVYNNYLKTTPNNRPRRVDQALFGKTVSGDTKSAHTYLRYLYFCGNDTGGTDHITLPFTTGRPDYTHAYDTLTGSPISYQTNRASRALAYRLN